MEILSETARQAIDAIVFVNKTKSATSNEIADGIGCRSTKYLRHILRMLTLSNLLAAKRGCHGGYCSSRPLAKVTVYDVLDAIGEGQLPANRLGKKVKRALSNVSVEP